MRQIEQPPQLARPDHTNPHAWASVPSLHTEWFRFVAPQLGLDTETIILANALSNIIGDDENAFGVKVPYMSDFIDMYRMFIYTRMDWEMNLPELPVVIRDQISTVRKEMDAMSWDGEENFYRVFGVWKKGVKNFIFDQIADHPHLQAALDYHDEVMAIWTPYWSEFLHGNATTA